MIISTIDAVRKWGNVALMAEPYHDSQTGLVWFPIKSESGELIGYSAYSAQDRWRKIYNSLKDKEKEI